MARETLRAIITANAATFKKNLESAAEGVRDAGEAAVKGAVSMATLSESMDITESEADTLARALSDIPDGAIAAAGSLDELREEANDLGGDAATSAMAINQFDDEVKSLIDDSLAGAKSVSELEDKIEEAGDSASTSAVQTGGFSAMLGGLAAQAMGTRSALSGLEEQTDEAGDEAVQATSATGAYTGILLALTGNAGGAAVAVQSLNLSLGQLLGITLGVVAVLTALLTVIGGIAVAATAAAAGVAALFGGGLLMKGEEIAATSEDIESAWQGIAELFTSLSDEVNQALAPLQTASNQEFFMGFLEGAIELLGIMAESVSRVAEPLREISDTVAGAFWDQTPEFFAQLEMMIVELQPILENMGEWFAYTIPDAMGVLTQTLKQLAPTLGGIWNQFTDLIPTLVSLGSTLIRIGGPILEMVLAVFGTLLTILDGLLAIIDPLLPAIDSLASSFAACFDAVNWLIHSVSQLTDEFINWMTTSAPIISTIYDIAVAVWELGDAIWFVRDALTGGVLGAIGGAILGGIGGFAVGGPAGAVAGGTLGAKAGFGVGTVGSGIQSATGGGDPSDGRVSSQSDLTLEDRMSNVQQDSSTTEINIGPVDASGGGDSASRLESIAEDAARRALKEERKRESGS